MIEYLTALLALIAITLVLNSSVLAVKLIFLILKHKEKFYKLKAFGTTLFLSFVLFMIHNLITVSTVTLN